MDIRRELASKDIRPFEAWRAVSKAEPGKAHTRHERTRSYLRKDEVAAMVKAAWGVGRHGLRDALFIQLSFRHGLRIEEAVNVCWNQMDFANATFHVNRIKGSLASTHELQGDTLRMLRRLQRQNKGNRWVFENEQGGPLEKSGMRKKIVRAGVLGGIPFPVNPHALRHGAGFHLAHKGVHPQAIQQFMGHVSLDTTMIYIREAGQNLKGIWD